MRSEAADLAESGHRVTVICPRGPSSGKLSERVAPGVTLYQYPAPPERGGLVGYLLEYGWSMAMMAVLSLVVAVRDGFDVVPGRATLPDVLVLIGSVYKACGKRFVFDHHDLAPEMSRARFGGSANPILHRMLGWFQRLSFRIADKVISTNDSYRRIAITHGGVDPSDVTVVRNERDCDSSCARFLPMARSEAVSRPCSGTSGSWAPRTVSTACWGRSGTSWSTSVGPTCSAT